METKEKQNALSFDQKAIEKKQNVSLFVLRALNKEGIDHVFLVPGYMVDPFLQNFEPAGIKAVVAAKEDGAAYMADGYGRAVKNFGVCMGIGGPGITNMTTPMSAAYGDRTSILALAGSIKFEWRGRGTFQDSSGTGVDDIAVMNPMTAFAQIIPDVDNTSPFIKKAIKAMRGIENLPAFLSIPVDIQTEELTKPYVPLNLKEPPRILDKISIQKVPDSLTDATRIVILAGNGCVWSDAEKEIVEFAEKYSIPVVTTLRAKGAISEKHPMSFGVFGLGGSLHANKAVMGKSGTEFPNVEVLLVLGATLNENNTHGGMENFPPEKNLIRVDINPNNERGLEVEEHFVMGDVKTFLNWMKENQHLYHDKLMASRSKRTEWIESIKKTPYHEEIKFAEIKKEYQIHPAHVILELRKIAPDNTVLVVDSGAHTFFSGHYWKSYAPNEFLVLSTTGPMGYGISMGIGAKCGRPEQPCVCVVGDGSMLMGGMELVAAIRYNIPIVIVVINNSALGNVYMNSKKGGPEAIELTTIPTKNWADFAQSLGAGGIVVKDLEKLGSAFKQAFGANKPFLIDVRCERDVKTPNTESEW